MLRYMCEENVFPICKMYTIMYIYLFDMILIIFFIIHLLHIIATFCKSQNYKVKVIVLHVLKAEKWFINFYWYIYMYV